MISFESDFYFHALWVIPLLSLIYYFNVVWQRKASLKAGDPEQVNRLLSGRKHPMRLLRFLLLIMAILTMVLALANPEIETSVEGLVQNSQTEIVFAVDVSNSMMAADLSISRLSQAQALLSELLKQLNNEQAGMVIYAGRAYPYVPLTSDYGFLSTACKSLSPALISRQGTSLGDALKLSASFFTRNSKKARVVLVISDGESHTTNYKPVADSLQRLGIHLFAVGIGTTAGANVPMPDGDFKKDRNGQLVVSRLNEEALKSVAPANYFHLGNRENVIATLISQIGKLKEHPDQKVTDKQGLYKIFLAAAFFLLLLEFSLPYAMSGKSK